MSLSYSEIKTAFDQIDKDNSGALELNEIIELSKGLGEEASPESILKIFGEIDENNDRKISFHEFLSWYRFGKDIPIAEAMKAHMTVLSGIDIATKKLETIKERSVEGEASLDGDGSETQTKLSHIEFRYKPSSSYTTMKEGKTVVKLEVQSGEKNTLLGALKVAFENYDESKPYFFFTLRAKDNVQDLVTAVDKFLTNVMLLLEILSKDSYDKHMTKIDYRVTQINSKVTVILDLGHDFTKDFVEQLDYFFKLFAKIKPNLIIKLKSYVDFLDILPKNLAELNHLELDENNEVIQPETEQGNTRFQDPNLFDFILKGFTFTSKLTCSSHVKTFIKSIAVDLIKDFGHPLIGMGLAESPEALVAKLLPEVEEEIYKTFEFENLKAKINDLLKGSEIHFPDGVDFIDEIGEIFNIMGEPLDRAPFAQEFMDDLSDLALLDADCGIIHRSSRVSFGFKSRGMKEMYEKVMEGVTEVEFEGW